MQRNSFFYKLKKSLIQLFSYPQREIKVLPVADQSSSYPKLFTVPRELPNISNSWFSPPSSAFQECVRAFSKFITLRSISGWVGEHRLLPVAAPLHRLPLLVATLVLQLPFPKHRNRLVVATLGAGLAAT